MSQEITRRQFIKRSALAGSAIALSSIGCNSEAEKLQGNQNTSQTTGPMTLRTCPNTGDQVSILGYGMMRLPTISNTSGRESNDEMDQEQINRLVDYAIEHGVNLFDTSPAYCKGRSETATGIALSRHPREKYFVSTKMSNFAPQTWAREESIKIYQNSMKYLQVDKIDYMLLHSVGGTSVDLNGNKLNSLETLNARFIDNGILDYLVNERKEGRIRNLGFSYHGDIAIFDMLLKWHDEGKYKFDFALIQLNYVDWLHAKEVNPSNTNGQYLQTELEKRGLPCFIMEPILGGRLANVPQNILHKFQERRPMDSAAKWAFRFCGTPKNVLTVLSGMTYMEHLQENVQTYSSLDPITEDEAEFLEEIAKLWLKFPVIPCTTCQYCMPCPYGVDIPTTFLHYNNSIAQGNVVSNSNDPDYKKARRAFLVGYDRKAGKEHQADHCISCGECLSHCPQKIDIPQKLSMINDYLEQLKQETL